MTPEIKNIEYNLKCQELSGNETATIYGAVSETTLQYFRNKGYEIIPGAKKDSWFDFKKTSPALNVNFAEIELNSRVEAKKQIGFFKKILKPFNS